MRADWLTGAVMAATLPVSAQFCRPQDFTGAYGFQLAGTTTISGDTKPVASMGRLEFDGRGGVSGTSSVNFAGYLLGNPVTGSYQVRNDCSLTWSLQDDSGAFQHFAGKLSTDLQRAGFQQTDAGGAQRGMLAKVASDCSLSALRRSYDFSVSGSAIPMIPGERSRSISLEGILTVDAAGNLTRLEGGAAMTIGTAAVDSDCIVNMVLTPSAAARISLRGVLVNGGREILAIETDPEAAVNAHLVAR